MRERDYQSGLIKRIKERFDGCIVLKNDAKYKQGFPDLTVLYFDKWAALECKADEKASHQPHQDEYVEQLNNMSFSAFIYPENEEEVLNAMAKTFKDHRSTRIPRCE